MMKHWRTEYKERFGIMYLLNKILDHITQPALEQFSLIVKPIIYDIIQLRQDKHGYPTIQLYLLVMTLNKLSQLTFSQSEDLWLQSLDQMFEYATTELKFIDLNTNQIVEVEEEGMNVVEKKFVILPQLFYILDRLEGYRRSFICDVTILCSKLKTLCLFNQHISAIEDIPLLIGVLIDILNFSAVNPFIRGGIIE